MKIGHMRPSTKRLCKYTFVALIVSILSNVPIFFEFTTFRYSETNSTMVTITTMRINENYIIFYKNIFEGIGLMIVPLLAMMYFNARIIYALTQRRRALVTTNSSNKRVRNEVNLAVVLVAMDVVFLVCNSGRVTVNLWEIIHILEMKECMGIQMLYKVNKFSFTNRH